MSSFNTVRIERKDRVGFLTLNRPEVRNAISTEMLVEVSSALKQFEEDAGISVVVLQGGGPSFCAGADIAELANDSGEGAALSPRALFEFFGRMNEFKKPLIASVHGYAIGGGCGLVTVCDLVVASEDAVFGYGEVKIGFVPALVSVFLSPVCGEKKARELLLTGRRFSAAEGLEFGLVTTITKPDERRRRTLELAESIAENSQEAVCLTKELLGRLRGLGASQALKVAAHYNQLARESDDFREGIAAFLEKRKPRWSGKP